MALSYSFLTFTLVPLPTSARPVTPVAITARRNASAPIDHAVVFDIAFALVLLFAFLGSFAWLASRWTAGAQPAEFVNRLCAVPIALSRQLSVLCPSTFVEGAAAAKNVNIGFVPRRGGASYPVATVPGGLRGEGPKWGPGCSGAVVTVPAASLSIPAVF